MRDSLRRIAIALGAVLGVAVQLAACHDVGEGALLEARMTAAAIAAHAPDVEAP